MNNKKLVDVPRIRFSNKNCIINGRKRPNIGVLFDEYLKPVIPVTDYLIDYSIKKANTISSVKVVGIVLRGFWEFISSQKLNWESVSDNVLVKWRDMMESGQRVTKGQILNVKSRIVEVKELEARTINERIGFVFHFYKWAKENRYVQAHVIGSPTDGGTYMITAVLDEKGKWRWPYMLKNVIQKRPVIPGKDDIDDLHQILDEIFSPVTASRNRLAAHWYAEAGLRGKEGASLTIQLIPEREIIDNLLITEKRYIIDFSPKTQGVSTKGNKPREISVDPMLLKLTKDYIEDERPDIVEKGEQLAKKKSQPYLVPDQVFLNVLTGNAISAKTLQNEFCTACKKAGLDTSGHGLRKYHAMRIVTDLYLAFLEKANGDMAKVDVNAIILYAKEDLGHSLVGTTIKHYIDIIALRLLVMSESDRISLYNGRKGIIERELAHIEHKLEKTTKNLTNHNDLIDAIRNNDKNKAWEILKGLNLKKEH